MIHRGLALGVAGLVGFMATPVGAGESAPRVAYRFTRVVKVVQREQASDAVVGLAERLDGYFLERDDGMVRLKVPTAKVKELVDAVEKLGTVVERVQEASDLGDTMAEHRTRLASREEVLQRYFAVLSGAGPNAVVEVEREMTGIVQEIESLRGLLNVYEHELRYAEVLVRFSFKDRRPPARDGNSSFAWLNSVNLADLLSEFGHD